MIHEYILQGYDFYFDGFHINILLKMMETHN